jgi:hypothetical protein
LRSGGLTATNGNKSATPALHLLDTISVTEAESHLQNTKIVKPQITQEPADRRRQPLPEILAVVAHLATSARVYQPGNRPQKHFQAITVSQLPAGPQAAAALHRAGT